MSDELARAERVLYGRNAQAALVGAGGLGAYQQLTAEEMEKAKAAQAKFMRIQNRREALSILAALGRRHDDVAQAIREAREIADFLGLEID